MARTIGAGFDRLSPGAQRLFLGLGLLPLTRPGLWTAAVLLGGSGVDPAVALAQLTASFMIESVDAELRYRFHDLVRAYARHQGADRPGAAERVGAVERAAVGWLSLVVVAVRGAQALLTAASPVLAMIPLALIDRPISRRGCIGAVIAAVADTFGR